ncbi:MAG: TlpA family protein disulfide reductase [Phycisphaeraceae bacterium]|nr:TlpA family protein disulfide reductase [Phycisphaeraceae bacterium]MCB9848008.1 TlpA family protein disulfide reductase [Phycisphaeraceae bacterium]
MTDAPPPAQPRHFSGKAALAVTGLVSLVMCALVVVLSQRDVSKAMDERSDQPASFEPEIIEAATAVYAGGAQPVADDEPGWWRCALLIERDDLTEPLEIPFHLWTPDEKDSRPGYVRNGAEFLPVSMAWDDDGLVVDFPHFDSRIDAHFSEDGRSLIGEWTKFRPAGKSTMRFHAQTIDSVDPFYQPGERSGEVDSIRFNTWSEPVRWRIEFESSGIAKGFFSKGTAKAVKVPGGIWLPVDTSDITHPLRGTILTPTGDYRFLCGEAVDYIDIVRWGGFLSVFDGAHAFRFDFTGPASHDTISGDFYSGNTWHETFTATRLAPGEDFDLPDPFSEVSLKPGETRLNLPQLDDPKYANKPVIVEVFGTWCPNCHDANRLLVELYNQHHAEGLEILGLAYEHTDDEARSLKQIQRFRDRIGATWDIIPAGVSDKQKTAATLPALTDIKAYPTTIFLNRDHTVEAIHSGFSGPATGADYDRTREEFARHIEKILGS